ncbi:hypothetical protein OJF2_69690 [Aquisphaera giovannonii]|uniref:DUF4058 domain-containing protein n=1 Tax=Aquisphaera giovannonii TaxID=406548 RepID=A0A5B9WCG7_9BACT|nr:DUF4058 family protein [Aquisphaera giovannonii]QEH38368.1 hypothetical protein OJF2_69690 [Aquisphaera giovannonii]
MPLRDHFRPPLDEERSWDELHGAWPTVIVMDLNRRLPQRYIAAPSVHIGGGYEVDVASQEKIAGANVGRIDSEGGGLATAIWAPPRATREVDAELPDPDEYEVRVYDMRHGRRLVAAVEIISPSNKDRPESRRQFVAKCAALLREQVSVTFVDVVTTRQFNLYAELLDWTGHADPSQASEASAIYAATCRRTRVGRVSRLEAWAHPLSLGKPLPTLPLWLADDLAVPLDLEATYEQTCRILRFP